MSIRNDIELGYSSVVAELADRARLIMSENGGDVDEAIEKAIDDGFFYSDDEAIVLAWSYEQGFFRWGQVIEWNDVIENLKDDIKSEVENERE